MNSIIIWNIYIYHMDFYSLIFSFYAISRLTRQTKISNISQNFLVLHLDKEKRQYGFSRVMYLFNPTIEK